MTDRFVGPGGNDGSDGLTWANRKLTLNGVEDTPVVAGDTVYVGPGVYRELLTVDVSGDVTGGPITYIGDVTGENTDSVGGSVRITGSDNDQTTARASCVSASSKNFRTFRGFVMDMASSNIVDIIASTDWIVEDSSFTNAATDTIDVNGAGQADVTVRRCRFYTKSNQMGINFNHSSTVDNTGHLVENCYFYGHGRHILVTRIGGIIVKNCSLIGSAYGLRVITAPSGGQTITVNNCIIAYCQFGLRGTVTGQVVEDFNSFYANGTDRNTVATGASSNTFPPLFEPPTLFDGILIPYREMALSEWSQIARIAGTSEATDDFYGVVRPTVSAKKSWGAIQLREAERETGTVQTGSAALTLADAGDHQIYVPVTATSTTFKVAARYESEYAGTLPRIIVRQPGQADSVDTMVAAADTWEDIEVTLTPAADPPYVVVILRSLNTSVTGDFDTYFDDLDVS